MPLAQKGQTPARNDGMVPRYGPKAPSRRQRLMRKGWHFFALFVAPAFASRVASAALAVLVAVASVARAAHQCSDPGLQATRRMYRECTSSAIGAFTDAIDACIEHDLQCVDACRFDLEGCRDATGAGGE